MNTTGPEMAYREYEDRFAALKQQNADLTAEVERLRDADYLRNNQLAAISTALMSDTPITHLNCKLTDDHPCNTAAYQDAMRTIDKVLELRAEIERLKRDLCMTEAERDAARERLAEAVRVIEPVKREADNREDYMHPSWNDDAHIELTLTVRECRAAAAFLARSGGVE